MHHSHLTQQLLNYFDLADQRVRSCPYTLDAQLLNLAAGEIEDLELRYGRELAARFVSTCPSLIDNRGVYFGYRVPSNFSMPATPVVQGLRNNAWVTLQTYNDTLPVPVRIEVDPNRSIVQLNDPTLFTQAGSSQQVTLTPAFYLPIPMPLTFWLDTNENDAYVDILITGLTYPCSAWPARRVPTSEELILTQSCAATSTKTWARIDSIQIRGLDSGATLTCWHMPFNLPARLDVARPFIHPMFRDQQFDRYWKVENDKRLLKETYYRGIGDTLEYAQSYLLPETLNDVAVEPRTFGMLALSNNKLYYFDRREPLPDLTTTGLTSEPYYSISVIYDELKEGPTRHARIQPLAHAGFAAVKMWRYVLATPAGELYAISSQGAFLPYSGGAGWVSGAPTEVSVALTESGTYVFSVECLDDTQTITVDNFPYPNLSLNALAALDLRPLVPRAQGIAFDNRERLWIWTAGFAVPVRLRYDAYIYDDNTRNIFVTDSFDQVQIS